MTANDSLKLAALVEFIAHGAGQRNHRHQHLVNESNMLR